MDNSAAGGYNGRLFLIAALVGDSQCQWNYGSNALSSCATNCRPSNSTPGSVLYRSRLKATSCVSTRRIVSCSIGSMTSI
ncbi:hypothetical protein PSEUDO8Z_190079 [Pseudomonas sp. 8Z]|nr:hypothetical protein PSEUDO8Z_190079 [Pseudomonas sp. 8Z]